MLLYKQNDHLLKPHRDNPEMKGCKRNLSDKKKIIFKYGHQSAFSDKILAYMQILATTSCIYLLTLNENVK